MKTIIDIVEDLMDELKFNLIIPNFEKDEHKNLLIKTTLLNNLNFISKFSNDGNIKD